MIVSTKGRYALRVLIDIAENSKDGKYIALKGIAERQQISQKYIEAIMTMLSKGGLVDAAHGKGGGYKLNRKPEEYKMTDILSLTEGDLAPVACLETGALECEKAPHCRTLPMWKDLHKTIKDFFDSYTIADLMNKK
ncbi:MAG: Rrf2 family transcriptional regulator [Treponema sp.]|nr:Rrf2 family transcriptional regulator [Spirochaetales bacterium]MDY5812687.1 Rrf2 family transcriptional regulator [Treponema sp.]